MRFVLSTPPLRASVGSSFELRDARASREGAFKELLLLEKHLSQEQCPECCHKHLFCAIAYLEEARTLLGGDQEDTRMARILRESESDLPYVDVRPLRKELASRLKFTSYKKKSAT